MEEILEIVLRAIDDASSIFSSVSSSADEMGTAIQDATTESSTGFEDVETSATAATGSIQDVIDACANIDNGTGPRDAAAGMDELEKEADEADGAVKGLSDDLALINGGMLLQTAEQIGQIGGKAEGMAQDMNTAAISVGQLATQTGIAEPQMVNLINTISNATFPNDEAMMYVKSLDQIGVASENLGASATNLDKINDAFGLGASTVNSLGQELSVLGVDMNNVETAFNALAYANANTVGGMENYYTFLRKYDSQFKELGFNVDQASVIIAAATQKFGGGRAALSGLSEALESCNGDTRALEEALNLEAGSLDNASALTGQYSGVLEQLAGEEAEHKTLLDQLGAAWEDFSLAMSGVLSPLGSAIGLIGQAGSFALQINGLITLGSSLKGVTAALRDFNLVQSITTALEGEGAVARVASALGIVAEATAAEGATVAFGGLAIAEGAALWPILAIIAAIALLVVAIYEIGKAFGWWDDVGEMFEAIQAGVMRLWSAFINHPDVQAAISAISSALSTLWSWIQQAGQAVMNFFGINSSGNFDFVRALIDSLGKAWEVATFPIRFMIRVYQELLNVGSGAAGGLSEALGGFYNDVLVPLGSFLSGAFSGAWSFLLDLWNQVVEAVQPIIEVFSEFMQGQTDLGDVVLTVVTSILNLYIGLYTQIGSLILTFVSNMFTWAVQAGLNFLNGINSYLSQLAVRVYGYLVNTYNSISTQLTLWVNKARAMAQQFVNTIINFVKQLPGKVLSVLMNVVASVRSGIQAWISTATSKVTELINKIVSPLSGLAGKIASAISGVADAFAKPFKDAWKLVEPVYNKLKDAWNFVSGTGWGTDIADEGNRQLDAHESAEGTDSAWGTDLVYTVPENSVEVNENLNVTLDFANVPNHLDTDTLVSALTDRNVLRALVGNRDFQSLDAKVKGQLVNRNRRVNGV